MSQAHRPTWNPTQGRETKAGSQQISKLSLASYTKLKFRQPGQTSTSDVARRDLRAELAAAERVALDKKRKAAGLPALDHAPSDALRIEGGKAATAEGGEEEGDAKRRKVLEEAAELDRDDSDDEDGSAANGTSGNGNGASKGKGKAMDQDADDDDDEDDDDDDE